MLPCIFLRINDFIYNVNSIKQISFSNTKYWGNDNDPIVKMLIIFNDYMDVSPKHFYTYYQSIGQLMYDWENSRASFFEIPYLELSDVIEMHKKFQQKMQDEIDGCQKNDE
jgi:hypothetical protein